MRILQHNHSFLSLVKSINYWLITQYLRSTNELLPTKTLHYLTMLLLMSVLFWVAWKYWTAVKNQPFLSLPALNRLLYNILSKLLLPSYLHQHISSMISAIQLYYRCFTEGWEVSNTPCTCPLSYKRPSEQDGKCKNRVIQNIKKY